MKNFTTFILLFLITTGAIFAQVQTWQFQDVTLDTGGTVVGTFDYDPSVNNGYSNISISVINSPENGDNHYQVLIPNFTAGPTAFAVVSSSLPDLTGAKGIAFSFATSLGNTGGTDTIAISPTQLSAQGVCEDANCSQLTTPYDVITSGSITKVSPFITTWHTTATNESITIPTASGETYDYTISWGDGTTHTIGATGDATHTYASAGDYTVTITGTFPRIHFNNSEDRTKIIAVNQWGSNSWSSMQNAFYGCSSMDVTATDTPNLANAVTTSYMFRNCWSLEGNEHFNSWDVTNIDYMRYMFFGAAAFNQDISGWSTGNVTNMQSMFESTVAFDQNLGGWDVTSLNNAFNMFFDANLSTSNYDALLIGWAAQTLQPNVNFHGGNSQFCNGDVAKNTLTNATNNWTITDAGTNCSDAFITTWRTDIANTGITIPTTGSGYDYTIDWGDGTLQTNQTGTISHTYATAGDHTVKISGDFPRISLTPGSNSPKLREVQQWGSISWGTMQNAFSGCDNLNVTATDAPDLSNVTSMNSMFLECFNLVGTDDFNSWDTSNVNDMSSMFEGATAFNQDIGNWDISSLTQAADMFKDVTLSQANYDALLIGWRTIDNAAGETGIMTNVTFSGGNSTYCDGATARFGLTWVEYGWNITDGGEDCSDAFIMTWHITADNESITIPTFPGETYNYNVNWGDYQFDTNQTGDATHQYFVPGDYTVTITGTFPRIYFDNQGDKDKIIAVNQWGTNPWTSMESAFLGAENLDVVATDTPNLTNVLDMSYMFGLCSSLVGENANFNSWDVSGVTNMNNLFNGASAFNQNIGNWVVSNVTDMNSMFRQASVFNQNIGGWVVSNVDDMSNMFNNATLPLLVLYRTAFLSLSES